VLSEQVPSLPCTGTQVQYPTSALRVEREGEGEERVLK